MSSVLGGQTLVPASPLRRRFRPVRSVRHLRQHDLGHELKNVAVSRIEEVQVDRLDSEASQPVCAQLVPSALVVTGDSPGVGNGGIGETRWLEREINGILDPHVAAAGPCLRPRLRAET